MRIQVKICGISTLTAARTALENGADYLGFISFAKSPRHLSLQAMAGLMQAIRHENIHENRNVPLVSVVVNPDDDLLEALTTTVKPDMIQLHGKETPKRVADIKSRFNIPLIKAISVSEKADLNQAAAYEPYVDYLMFDAKTPKDAAMPGGLGLFFDWSLMHDYAGTKPWFLAGGLNADNAHKAVNTSGALRLDVSSGVESVAGVKDNTLISAFLKTAKSL
ncbi:MAG: phosphoribosylanthranilate isomerase [Asticcacaulis sp.]